MRIVALLVLALLVTGCREESGGRVEVSWTGADTGQFTFPGRAEWCAGDTMLQVIGEAGDSGIIIAVFPRDTIAPGTYPVTEPTRARTRPSARAAMRWFGETLVQGYHSLSGVVQVDSGSTVSGKVEATVKSVNDGGQLNLTGRFNNLAMAAGTPVSCGADAPLGPDTTIH